MRVKVSPSGICVTTAWMSKLSDRPADLSLAKKRLCNTTVMTSSEVKMAAKSRRKKSVPNPPEASNAADVADEVVQDTAEGLAKLAESQLEMARLFIDRGKSDIARRRLDEILELYPDCAAAGEAKKLLKRI